MYRPFMTTGTTCRRCARHWKSTKRIFPRSASTSKFLARLMVGACIAMLFTWSNVMSKRFLSKKEVRDKVKLSNATIDRRENAKPRRFPKRHRLGIYRNSRAVWLESDIDAWMDEQMLGAS